MRNLYLGALFIALLSIACGDAPPAPVPTGTELTSPTDTQPPTVSITAPAIGAVMTGAVAIRVDAHDDVGVTKVELQMDGVLAASATTTPYEFIWNTDDVIDGPVTLLARAYDASANMGLSAPVSVTVRHPIRYRGSLSIPQTWNADLEQGTLVDSRPPADLWFQAVTATERYLTPVGGTKAAIYGSSAPTKARCLAAALSSEGIALEELPRGTFVCVLTGDGRISHIDVIREPGPSSSALVIGIKTFALSPTDTTINPSTLLAPPRDSYVYQYANAPHCNNQFGFRIDYRWSAVPDALYYQVYAIGRTAIYPLLNNVSVVDTVFTDARCGSYVARQNAMGWTWRVTVVLRDGTRLTSVTERYHFTDPFQP